MISQTAEYALRAATYLVCHNGKPITRREISEGTLISMDYLPRVLVALSEAEIVTIKRGPGGGYSLAVDKQTLTVYDIVSAVEEVPRINKCPLGLKGHESLCPLHAALDRAAELVEQSFRETLLIDLLPSTRKRKKATKCEFPAKAD